MGSADATRRVPWLRYALLGIVIAAIWLAFSLLSGAVGGASAEENTPAVVPAHGVDSVSPTTPPQAAAPEVDAPPGPADAADHAPAAPAAEHPASVEPADAAARPTRARTRHWDPCPCRIPCAGAAPRNDQPPGPADGQTAPPRSPPSSIPRRATPPMRSMSRGTGKRSATRKRSGTREPPSARHRRQARPRHPTARHPAACHRAAPNRAPHRAA